MSHANSQPLDSKRLLTEQDGSSFEWANANDNSACVLVCEHASNRIPNNLDSLGLTEAELQSHIAWDRVRTIWRCYSVCLTRLKESREKRWT